MALSDDVTALPATLTDGEAGHIEDHLTIHTALKDHRQRISTTESGLSSKAETTYVNTQISGLGTTYATKAELANVVAGDQATINDVTVSGLLTDPTTATGTALGEHIEARAGEIYADIDYTGATDAAPRINQLIAQASRTGAPIKLGVGTIRLESAIRPYDGTHLIGSGWGKTILKPQGAAHAISTGIPVHDVVFRDFEIDGSDQAMPEGEPYHPTYAKGIFLEYMRRVTVENVYIHDTAATGLGIDFITGTIRNVWAVRCGRLNDGTGAGGSGIGIGVGRLDPDWEPLTIVACHTEGNGRFGIFLENQDTGIMPGGITITACTSIGNKDGIGECGSTGTIIAHNHIRDNTRSGISVDTGTMERTTPGRFALIQGNDITGNAGPGIHMRALGEDEALDGVRILDNHIWENTGPGIEIVSSAYSESSTVPFVRNLRIESNDIHHNGGVGVSTKRTGASHPAWSHVMILNNRAWGNGTAGVVTEDAGFKLTAHTDHLVMDGNHTWEQDGEQPRSIVLAGTHSGLKINQEYLHAPAVIPS